MALVIPPGFGLASIHLALDNDVEPIAVTLGVEPVSPPLSINHAYQVQDAFRSTVLVGMANDYRLAGVRLQAGQDAGEPITFDVTPATEARGGATSEPLPQNCSLLIRKLTALGGRRGRGRMFLPGIDEDTVSSAGFVAGSTLTAWQGIFDDFFDALPVDGAAGGVGDAVNPVLLHSEVVGETTPAPTAITGFAVQSVIATQRRRLRR